MMSDEQARRAAERLAAKRAVVLGKQGRKRRFVAPLLAGVLVLGVAGALVARMLPEEHKGPAGGAVFGYMPRGGEVTYARAELDGRSARFYQHKAEGGVIVRYFLYGGADGATGAALDACASCWREGKGHRQEGDEMVCVQCDKRFTIADLGKRSDPCAPISLPVTVRDGEVAVAIPDLLEAAKYFTKPYRSL